MKRLFIEREVATGWKFYVLRDKGAVLYASENIGNLSRFFTSEPFQTYDYINNITYRICMDFYVDDVTIVPGLKITYPVYEGDNISLIAKMERVYNDDLSYTDQYCFFTKNKEKPIILSINTGSIKQNNALTERLLFNKNLLSQKIIHVCFDDDESFIADTNSLSDKRWVINVDKAHYKYLPHIFNAFLLLMCYYHKFLRYNKTAPFRIYTRGGFWATSNSFYYLQVLTHQLNIRQDS